MSCTIFHWDTEKIEQEYFNSHVLGVRQQFVSKKTVLELAKLSSKAQIITVFIKHTITQEILDMMPHLKLIVTRSTGIDHIDINACKARNIKVKNIAGYGAASVAEHTFALLLSLTHNLRQNISSTLVDSKSPLIGSDLCGKTLGIVGVNGAIGSTVARIATAFGMKIVGNDIKEQSKLMNKINIRYVTLQKLFEMSDYVTLHCPLNPKTRYSITKEILCSANPNGIYFINTARGALIQNDVLLMALKKKIILAAGLDVLDTQDKEIDQQIINLSNVVYTPHLAYYTRESLQKIAQKVSSSITTFLHR